MTKKELKFGELQVEFLRNSNYIKKGQTLDKRIDEILGVVSKYEDQYSEGLADRLRYSIENKILVPSTPQWGNTGVSVSDDANTVPLPCSCNIITVGDSIQGIYYAHGEAAMLSKLGAGVGADFTQVAQKGTELSEGFYSNSVMDWIETAVDTSQKVSQNSLRRGYLVPFLSIDSNDFHEFLDRSSRENSDASDPMSTNNVGVIIPTGFFDRLAEGEEEARKRFLKVLNARDKMGNVYIVFIENMNKNQSEVYKALGHEVRSTNICCVTGDTLILTDKGEQEIRSKEGEEVTVWNGEEWSEVTIIKTSDSDEIYTVTLKGGKKIRCNGAHVFYDFEGTKLTTLDLQKGMKLLPWATPQGRIVIDTVEELQKELLEEPTWCFTEPKRGMGVFNGVLTGQCEVVTPHYEDKTFACIIASLNLNKWEEIKANPQLIKDAYMFLDIMVQEYIRLTEGVPFMDKARRSAMEKRDVGLGTLGFHDLLQSRNMAFGDIQSRILNNEVYRTIRQYCDETNDELATLLGACPMAQEAGLNMRNVSMMMVAPNKSTSFFAGEPNTDTHFGASLGIEPLMSNYFVKKLAGIQVVTKNLRLERLLKELGQNTTEVWDSISKHNGSVQHLSFLTEKQKDVFKTFAEISPKDIIDLAASRQKYIDMAQSINLMNRASFSITDLVEIHKYAFTQGIKTLYYMYSASHAALSDESNDSPWDACLSCAD